MVDVNCLRGWLGGKEKERAQELFLNYRATRILRSELEPVLINSSLAYSDLHLPISIMYRLETYTKNSGKGVCVN